MKTLTIFISGCFVLYIGFLFYQNRLVKNQTGMVLSEQTRPSYWFLLQRKSNIEHFYYGVLGDASNSKLLKTFQVKSGVPGERPTPLPQIVGREYWLITDKLEAYDNPETAPYFLTFDIPVTEEEPFGPTPYEECNGQCNWGLPGYFGLHGVAGNSEKLADTDPGSSGCVRHSDDDITYLYNLLDPHSQEIRYYIQDI